MRKRKFIRIETKEIGRIDENVVVRPSSKSSELYYNPLDCFYNIGDRICLFDKSKYSENQISYMTNSDKWKAVFTDKHYIFGTIEERINFYIMCKNIDTVETINSNQLYAEKIRIKTDNGDEFVCAPIYYCLMGRVINEKIFDNSKTKCI